MPGLKSTWETPGGRRQSALPGRVRRQGREGGLDKGGVGSTGQKGAQTSLEAGVGREKDMAQVVSSSSVRTPEELCWAWRDPEGLCPCDLSPVAPLLPPPMEAGQGDSDLGLVFSFPCWDAWACAGSQPGPVVQSPFGLKVPSGANDLGREGSEQWGSSLFLGCRRCSLQPMGLTPIPWPPWSPLGVAQLVL